MSKAALVDSGHSKSNSLQISKIAETCIDERLNKNKVEKFMYLLSFLRKIFYNNFPLFNPKS